MVRSKSLLIDYTEFAVSRCIKLGDGSCVYAYGRGSIQLECVDSTYASQSTHVIEDVWYVPSITFNILSVAALTEQRFTVTFEGKYCCITDRIGTPIMSAVEKMKLYCVEVRTRKDKCVEYVHGSLNVHTVTQDTTTQTHTDTQTDTDNETANLWHARLGHISKTSLTYLKQYNTVDGIPSLPELTPVYKQPCEHCCAGAFPAQGHARQETRSTEPLELVFADVTGPYRPGMYGSTVCLNVIDSYSGYGLSIPLKGKDQVPKALLQALDRLSSLGQRKVQGLRTDQGTEFHNSVLMEGLASRCITLTHSVPYQHQQVGCVENYNKTIGIITRSLLSNAHRSKFLWPEAMKCASYLYNRRASKRVNLKQTHYQLLTGQKPNLSNLRVWGCKVYCRIPTPLQQDKLDPKCETGILVGYDDYSPAYRVKIGHVVVNRTEIKFDETALGDSTDTDYETVSSSSPTPLSPLPSHTAKKKQKKEYIPTSGAQAVKQNRRAAAVHHNPYTHIHSPVTNTLCVLSAGTSAGEATAAEACNPIEEQQQGCTGKEREHTDKSYGSTTDSNSIEHPFPVKQIGKELPIPSSYHEAVTCEYAHHWKKAIKSELDSLQEMSVFQVTALPIGRRPLTSKWVFTWKLDEHGIVQKAKARLVVRGFEQQPGIDFNELFSPTISQHSIRLLLAHSVEQDLSIHQIDFKTAFLNGDLEEEIYIRIPEGYSVDTNSVNSSLDNSLGTERNSQVWLLTKSLYGLKQAPRQWNKKLHQGLSTLGFVQSAYDPAMYYRLEPDSSQSYLLVHVDDMLIANRLESTVISIKSQLSSIFSITDLGRLHNYLNIQIEKQPDGSTFIHQSSYAKDTVGKFLDMTLHKHHADTPLPPGLVMTQLGSIHNSHPDDSTACDKPFGSLVMSLMYLANCTRPDLMHPISSLCRYVSKPSVSHWKAAQHVLAYLNTTHAYGIKYTKTGNALTGYCDSNHLTCVDTRRSITGYVFVKAGGAVSWQTKTQTVVAMSTAEAEYMAAGACGREAQWLSKIEGELLGLENCPVCYTAESPSYAKLVTTTGKKSDLTNAQVIMCDNQSALHMIKNRQCSKEIKHIDKIHHWVRDSVDNGELEFKFIPGKDNPADMFTKPLPRPAFIRFREMIGMSQHQ